MYRCFETKEHLVAAVLAERVRRVTELVAAAGERPSAWEAFTGLLSDLAARQASDCTFSEGLAHVSQLPELTEAKREMHAEMDRLMARAKAEGRMLADASSDDLRVLFSGMCRALRADGTRDPAAWQRYAALVADAFRAA